MTDREILAAMQTMLQPIKEDLTELKQDVSGLKQDVSELKKDVAELKDRTTLLESRTGRVEVLLEHDLPKQIKLLAEGHSGILNRLPEENEMNGVRNRLSTVEHIVALHTSEIGLLQKAN